MLVQAESALDQMDWIEKITGVIASLLSSQAPERVFTLLFFLLNSGRFSNSNVNSYFYNF